MKYLVKNLPEERYVEVITKHPDNCTIIYNLKDSGEFQIDSIILATQELGRIEEFGNDSKKDKKRRLIVNIKSHILKVISSDNDLSNLNFSYCLSEKLGYNYTYLTNIFSEAEGISIKKYIIQQTIERVKELLLNERLSLKQISSLMKYKNVSHLTNQFKKITGITPSGFRKMIV